MSKPARSDEPKVNPFQVKLKIQIPNRYLEFGAIKGVGLSKNTRLRRGES